MEDLLNREEATSLLKELNLACDGIGEQGVMLMPPNANDLLSKGYQLHIKTILDQEKFLFKPGLIKANAGCA